MQVRSRLPRAAVGATATGLLVMLLAAALLAGCQTGVPRAPTGAATPGSILPSPAPRPGGYYKDDGPGDNPPPNLDAIPDAIPKLEPLHRFANRPYSVFGRDYVPATTLRPYRERGIASWYGRKFHKEKTSTGEIYDMYAMTAAHPTLPLPSYARVTSVTTGKSVIVRVNDRGPFHPGRIIDLSYAAAYRLGIAQKGSGEVDVESVLASDSPPTLALTTPLAPVDAPVDASSQAIPVRQDATGFVLQLGAFANYANAQALLDRVANQIAPMGVEGKVRQGEGLFRVVVGPYSTRDDARRVGERLRTELGLDATLKTQ